MCHHDDLGISFSDLTLPIQGEFRESADSGVKAKLALGPETC